MQQSRVPSIHGVGVPLRAVRNAPLAASVAWRHLGRDRVHALLIGLRTLPPGIRRRLGKRVGRRRASLVGVLALAADGRRADAVRALRDPSFTTSARGLRNAVAAAAALDAPVLADQLLRQLNDHGTPDRRLAALVAARTGDLRTAEAEARQAGWAGRRLRQRLAGEIAAMSPDAVARSVTARSPAADSPAFEPVQGRVLHLVTNSLPEITAGYTVRTHGIARAQNRTGLAAHVATRLGFPVTAGALAGATRTELDGVTYHRALPIRWLPARADRALDLDVDLTAHLVRRLRPAVLHAHSKYVNAQVALALRDRFGLPVVYEVRGFLEETWRSRGHDADTDQYQLARAVETSCMRAADVVVTLAEVMRAEIVARGVAEDRVLVVPNAVDDILLAPAPDPGRLREQLGIGPGELVVGLVSTLNHYEGVDTLVEAVAELRGRGAPVRLLAVGNGPAAAGLRDQAAALGIADACIFTGKVPFARTRDYHAALDVFCLPRADVRVCRLVPPLKPLEAMAVGRPVVASDLPPLREMIDDGRTGALVPPGDSTTLADRLQSLADDPDERIRMGERAHSWVAEHRTWTSVAATYRAIYDKLGAT